jgi:hypothetical protein
LLYQKPINRNKKIKGEMRGVFPPSLRSLYQKLIKVRFYP